MRQIQIRRRPRTTRRQSQSRDQSQSLDLRTPSGRPLPF
jgi:hypothetical protein